MAISFRDHPAQQDFVDQYIPVPFQEINQAIQQRQHQYDVNEEAANEIQNTLLKVPALPGPATQRRDQIVNQYEDKIKSAVDNAGGDYSKLHSTVRGLSREIGRDLTRGELSDIAGSYSNYQNALVEFNKNKSQGDYGGQETTAQHTIFNKPFQEYNSRMGIPGNRFSPGTVGKYYDMGEEVSKLVHDWKPNEIINGLQKIVEPDGSTKFYQHGTTKTVDESEVFNTAKNYVLNNPKYKQQHQQTLDYYKTLYGDKALDVYNKELNSLVDLPSKRESYKQKTADFKVNPGYDNEQKNKEDKHATFIESTPSEKIKNLNSKLIEATTPNAGETMNFKGIGLGGAFTLAPKETSTRFDKKFTYGYNNLDEHEKEQIDNIAKTQFPNIKNEDEKFKLVNDYLKKNDNKIVSTPITSIPETAVFEKGKRGSEGYTEHVFGGEDIGKAIGNSGNYLNRDFRDSDGKVYTGQEFYDKILKKEDKNTKISVTGKYSNNNYLTDLTNNPRFSTAYQVVVGNKQFAMTGSLNDKIGKESTTYLDNLENIISKAERNEGSNQQIELPAFKGNPAKVNITFNKNKGYIVQADDPNIFTGTLTNKDGSLPRNTTEVLEAFSNTINNK